MLGLVVSSARYRARGSFTGLITWRNIFPYFDDRFNVKVDLCRLINSMLYT